MYVYDPYHLCIAILNLIEFPGIPEKHEPC